MSDLRELLKQYVEAGKLMQLATIQPDGAPIICNVWYDAHFAPDVLRFISRHDRLHSANIRDGRPAAGAIVAIELEGLGQTARGVTFTGDATELPMTGVDEEVNAFLSRWPRASAAIDPIRLSRGETPSRLYEVQVHEWVLFDEAHFPEQPRQVVPAIGRSNMLGR